MQEQLYLVEFIVENINFTPKIPLYNQGDLNYTIECGSLFSLELMDDISSKMQPPPEASNGKSYLFPMKTNELAQTLESTNIAVKVKARATGQQYGIADVSWKKEFVEMVKKSAFTQQLAPCTAHEIGKINDENGAVIGDVLLFIRLSCYGQSIQTQFQVVAKDTSKAYLFKNPNAKTTFTCKRFGQEGTADDVVPVAPLYNTEQFSKLRITEKDEMTEEELGKRICESETCPGALAFKELGIGPLTKKDSSKRIGDDYKSKYSYERLFATCRRDLMSNLEATPLSEYSRLRGGGGCDENCPWKKQQMPKIETLERAPLIQQEEEGEGCDEKTCPFIIGEDGEDGEMDNEEEDVECLPCPLMVPPVAKEKPLKKGPCGSSKCPHAEEWTEVNSPNYAEKLRNAPKVCSGPTCPATVVKKFELPVTKINVGTQNDADIMGSDEMNRGNQSIGCGKAKCKYSQALIKSRGGCGRPKCKWSGSSDDGVDSRMICEVCGGYTLTGKTCKDISPDNLNKLMEDSAAASAGQGDEMQAKGAEVSPSKEGKKVTQKIPKETASVKSNQNQSHSTIGTKSAPEVNAEKKRKKTSNFVYTVGETYPGVKLGHKRCCMPGRNVPGRMGWLWDIRDTLTNMKQRRGWKPGAVSRGVMERIQESRRAAGLAPLEDMSVSPSKKKLVKARNPAMIEDDDYEVHAKPTLQIKKKDGCYWITMNPLKDPTTVEDNEDPYMQCEPLQFKITKNRDQVLKVNSKDPDACECEELWAREAASKAAMSVSSSDSELNVEFTPPAGMIDEEHMKKKPNVVHADTQYLLGDIGLEVTDPAPAGGKKKGKGGKGKGKKKK